MYSDALMHSIIFMHSNTFCPRLRTRSESVVMAVPLSAAAYIIDKCIEHVPSCGKCKSTFDFGALNTVKLPRPAFFKVGFFAVGFDKGDAFFATGAHAVDDDSSALSDEYLARRYLSIDGKTPPCGITQPRNNYQ
jgi:hypothetical protein